MAQQVNPRRRTARRVGSLARRAGVRVPRRRRRNTTPNNTLASGAVPLVSTTGKPRIIPTQEGCIIHFKERIDVLVSSGPNTIFTYVMNPGSNDVFDWVPAIARNFESYKVVDFKAHYKTRCNQFTASGNVIMYMDYDVSDSIMSSINRIENSFGAKQAAPFKNFTYASTKFDLNKRQQTYYVGAGTNPGDRLNDFGRFYAVLDNCTNDILLGTLYFEYTFQFLTPVTPDNTVLTTVPHEIVTSMNEYLYSLTSVAITDNTATVSKLFQRIEETSEVLVRSENLRLEHNTTEGFIQIFKSGVYFVRLITGIWTNVPAGADVPNIPADPQFTLAVAGHHGGDGSSSGIPIVNYWYDGGIVTNVPYAQIFAWRVVVNTPPCLFTLQQGTVTTDPYYFTNFCGQANPALEPSRIILDITQAAESEP